MGEWIVRGSVWLALGLYPAGVWLVRADLTEPVWLRLRWAWSLGAAIFALHVISAFTVFYGWSHAVAIEETARQAEAVTGRAVGVGLYLNYLFASVWLVDAVRAWRRPEAYRRGSPAWPLLLHGFFLFMIINATVVFETGPVRWFGGLVAAVGLWGLVQRIAFRPRRTAAAGPG